MGVEMARNKEKWNAYMRAFRKSHPRSPEKQAAQNARNKRNQFAEKQTEAGRRQVRNRRFKLAYGITLVERDAMIAAQHGLCLICHQPLGADGLGGSAPVVDHDHETDTLRGILHRICNVAIGLLNDDPRLLRQAADYLEKF
jgi:hypothetical protein